MGSLATLTNILGLAIAAGLNLYAAVLVTGLALRFHWVQGLPDDMAILATTPVLAVAGLLYALEFLADKIPIITPIWDGLHLFIRPIGGALLAFGAAANLDPGIRLLAVLAAGIVAFGTHSSKMGVRLVAHAVPDPITHTLISVAEDFSVVGLLGLAWSHPEIALPAMAVIVLLMALFLPMLYRIFRFVLGGILGRLFSLTGSAGGEIADWARRAAGYDAQVGTVLYVFCRLVKGHQRMREGYLVILPGSTYLLTRRWFRTRKITVADRALGVDDLKDGMIYDILSAATSTFYVTKEWADVLRDRVPAVAATQGAV